MEVDRVFRLWPTIKEVYDNKGFAGLEALEVVGGEIGDEASKYLELENLWKKKTEQIKAAKSEVNPFSRGASLVSLLTRFADSVVQSSGHTAKLNEIQSFAEPWSGHKQPRNSKSGPNFG